MNYCYQEHIECEYANGAGFCTETACVYATFTTVSNQPPLPLITGSNIQEYDPVHAPQHYASQDIEPIEYMRAAMTNEEFVGYCCGNIIKYCSRWRDKNGIEDLEKARQYLDWMIEAAEKEDKNGSSEA